MIMPLLIVAVLLSPGAVFRVIGLGVIIAVLVAFGIC